MKTTKFLPLPGMYYMLILLLFSTKVFSQPDYIFRDPLHESGDDLKKGSIYLFKTVKPGVDARVEVISITGAISLSSIDETWTGFDEAFQPFLDVPAHSNGHVEFEIRFYHTGTTNPMNQKEVPVTPIDVDGAEYDGGNIFEYDQIKLSGGYYNFSTSSSEISVNQTAGWVKGKNISGWSYDGIDTTARNVMFTVVNANTTKVLVRIGAENTSDDWDVRYRSVYFKKFSYPSGILSSNPLMNFSGNAINTNVNLQYLLNDPLKIKTVMIERSASDMNFKTVQEIAVKDDVAQYQAKDIQMTGVSYYRLKIMDQSGGFIYSNVLRFESKAEGKELFKLYPSVIDDKAAIMLQSTDNNAATLQIFDYNGRLVYTKQITVQEGMNNLFVDGLGTLTRGNYIATVLTTNQRLQQKIVKR